MFSQTDRSQYWAIFWTSILTHVLLLGPAIYIVTVIAGANYSLFSWHPACLTIGCGLLMTEAVFAISGEALLAGRVSRTNRIKIHWILHALGLALLVVGFSVIVANKNRNNASHFTTSHGKLGLSTFIITLVAAIGGVLTLFSGLLSKSVSLATTKLIHGCGGILSIVLLLATLISGVFKGWWPGSEAGRITVVIAYVFGGILLLARPIYYSSLKIRGRFN